MSPDTSLFYFYSMLYGSLQNSSGITQWKIIQALKRTWRQIKVKIHVLTIVLTEDLRRLDNTDTQISHKLYCAENKTRE